MAAELPMHPAYGPPTSVPSKTLAQETTGSLRLNNNRSARGDAQGGEVDVVGQTRRLTRR